MPRFLIATWPFPGHVYPQMAIAHALRKRGHDVAFYTGRSAEDVVRSEGFAYFPFTFPEEPIYAHLFRPDRGSFEWNGMLKLQATVRAWLLGSVRQQASDIEQILTQWPADAIACDPSLWGPVLVTQDIRKIPVALSSFVPGCMVPGPDAPPFGLGLPLPRTPWARLVSRMIAAGTSLSNRGFRREVNEIRAGFGLNPLQMSVTAYTGKLPLHIIPATREFDYNRHDLPATVHYVGPFTWNKPQNAGSSAWLDAIPRDLPWVHVTEGTVHNNRPFVLRAAAEGLPDLPVRVIMTTGSDRDPADLGLRNLAPNIHVGRWVSHTDLLPLTTLVVTTGGAGTVLATLLAGLPLISIPTDWDKPEVAQRVVESGAGLRLAPKDCSARRLRQLVERILKESNFRDNAQRLAQSFRSTRGADEAAELLESLARGPSTR